MHLDPLIVAGADVTDMSFHGSKLAGVTLGVGNGDVRRREEIIEPCFPDACSRWIQASGGWSSLQRRSERPQTPRIP